jgi:predicted dehydrogenase
MKAPTRRASPASPNPAGRVGVIGAGSFGRFCIEAYRRSGDISVVAVADPLQSGSSIESFPDVQIEHDWQALIEDPLVEAIHLAAPPAVRAEVAVPALLAGKAVLCEKPLALSLSDADGMLCVSRETGSALGIDYVMRHHPAFRLLSSLASSGLLGSPRDVSLQNFAQSLPKDHWMWDQEVSGGVLVEHGVHFFDAYGQITGAPRRVSASAPNHESIQATVEYADGAIGSYYHEFAFPQEIERTRALVMFERGYVEIDGWIPDRVSGKTLAPITELEKAIQCLGLPVRLWLEGDTSHFEIRFPNRQAAYQAAIVAGMRDLITTQRDPSRVMVVSAQDARDSLALALAARKATETGTVLQVAS